MTFPRKSICTNSISSWRDYLCIPISTPLTGHDSDHGLNRIRIRFWDELGSCWITILTPDPIPCPWTHLDPGPWAHLGAGPLGPWAHLGPGPTQALGLLGHWAHLGPGPTWALGPLGPTWALGPLGPWAHLGPGPIWALGPFGLLAHLGPRLIWALDPFGPCAHMIRHQRHDHNWIWIWMDPVCDYQPYPVIRGGDQTVYLSEKSHMATNYQILLCFFPEPPESQFPTSWLRS